MQSSNLLRYLLISNALESLEETERLGTEVASSDRLEIEPALVPENSFESCSSSEFSKDWAEVMTPNIDSFLLWDPLQSTPHVLTVEAEKICPSQDDLEERAGVSAMDTDLSSCSMDFTQALPEKRRISQTDLGSLDCFAPSKRRSSVCCFQSFAPCGIMAPV